MTVIDPELDQPVKGALVSVKYNLIGRRWGNSPKGDSRDKSTNEMTDANGFVKI